MTRARDTVGAWFWLPKAAMTESHAVAPRRLLALVLIGLAGCSSLDADTDTFCELNADDESCGDDPRLDPFWCLDDAPPVLPAPRPATEPVGMVFPVVEWGTLQPLAGRGLRSALCTTAVFSCATPLGPIYNTVTGRLGTTQLPPEVAGIPVYEGFDGFVKFTVTPPEGTPMSQQYLPETYYLGGRVSGDVSQGPPLLMVQFGVRDSILQQSFPMLDAAAAAANGIVVVGAYDCNGNPVSNARIEASASGSNGANGTLVPFLLPASRIPIPTPPPYDQPFFTGTSGTMGYLNVPPGAVQVRAYVGNSSEPFGTAELGSVGGEITVVSIRPPYLNDANLVGVAIGAD
jgi:hypothetical protein